MEIRLKTYCYDVPSSNAHAPFTLPEGADVRTLLAAFCDSLADTVQLDREDFIGNTTVSVNSQTVTLGTELHEGDSVLLLRSMEGG